MDEEFNKIHHEILQQSNSWNKHRQTALNRISEIFLRYGLTFRIFGSYAYGLAIPSSDIDICVSPTIINYFMISFTTYRQKIIMALTFLKEVFQQTKWASNFNLIETAQVPVLSFVIFSVLFRK